MYKVEKNILLLFLTVFSFSSCIKKDAFTPNSGTALEKYFEDNVLNKNFIITLATNNGTDITANYNGYIITFLKTDYYHGPLQVTKGSNNYTGTWSSNEDYSKLSIGLPASPSEFVFLTRDWRFTKKALPELDLAPWGTADPYVLQLMRQ